VVLTTDEERDVWLRVRGKRPRPSPTVAGWCARDRRTESGQGRSGGGTTNALAWSRSMQAETLSGKLPLSLPNCPKKVPTAGRGWLRFWQEPRRLSLGAPLLLRCSVC